MYYSVKTLLSLGKNVSQIARELKIDRKTVRKIKKKVERGEIETPTIKRKSILDPYKDEIMEYLKNGLSAVLIHQKLKEKHNLNVSYSSVKPSRCRAITLVHTINQPTSNHSSFTCITIAGISSALAVC